MRATLRLVVCLIVLIGVSISLGQGDDLFATTIFGLSVSIHPLVVVVYDRHRHIKRLARIKRYADH